MEGWLRMTDYPHIPAFCIILSIHNIFLSDKISRKIKKKIFQPKTLLGPTQRDPGKKKKKNLTLSQYGRLFNSDGLAPHTGLAHHNVDSPSLISG
jgi:hypothetical protein